MSLPVACAALAECTAVLLIPHRAGRPNPGVDSGALTVAQAAVFRLADVRSQLWDLLKQGVLRQVRHLASCRQLMLELHGHQQQCRAYAGRELWDLLAQGVLRRAIYAISPPAGSSCLSCMATSSR